MNVSCLIMSMLSTVLCLALMGGVGLAQNSPQDFLSAHNVVRAQLGLNPLVWDTTVADFAQNYALQRSGDCQLIHSGGGYGENLFGGSSSEYTAADAVNMWVAEGADYDHASNTCASGKVCGHYTQVVWRNSVRLGCARVVCNGDAIFITCNYDPPGNVVGESPY